MHCEQQNLQSTLTTQSPPTSKLSNGLDDLELCHRNDNFFPTSATPNVRTNEVAFQLVPTSKIGKAYMDLTGKFPSKSAHGNQYILVAYNYDANAILAEPIKN